MFTLIDNSANGVAHDDPTDVRRATHH